MMFRVWVVGVFVSAAAAAVACVAAGVSVSSREQVVLAAILTAPLLLALLPRGAGE